MGKHQVEYGGRAFAQDANSAMKNDIVRGLVELITNCDDAYGDEGGKIRIEVEHRKRKPWKVVVRDRATGMRKEKMVKAIGGLGGRTSGFEQGKDVRGNLGRGAKDLAAFGPVTFESICDGYYSRMVLEEDGTYDEPEERKAYDEDRTRLKILRGSGTVVEVLVGAHIRCPLHTSLVKRLSQHYQLRDINSDSRRTITLYDLTGNKKDSLRYGHPSLNKIVEVDLEISGYPDAQAKLTVFKNTERFENAASDTGRPEGILVKGNRAIYENTLFGLESNPYAHWFSGWISCPYIDKLARDYDDRRSDPQGLEDANPMPIITRARDGLETEHPFRKALAAAAEQELGKLAKEEEERARQSVTTETARMRRTLDQLGRDLGQLVDADLRDIDEDGLPGDSSGDDAALMRIIPDAPVLYMGENKTLSVVVAREHAGDHLEIELDPEGVVKLLDGVRVALEDHPRREDRLIGRIRLRPLIEDDETYLTVRCGDLEAAALIEVRPKREDPEPPPPETFKFERERYTMSLNKRRHLTLLAPVTVVAEQGVDFSVSSDSQQIVVLGGGRAALEFDEELMCYVGRVAVDPRVLGEKATVTAVLGQLTATAEIVVNQQDGGGPSLNIRIVDEDGGKYRALVAREAEQTEIKILGRHPAIKPYLGPAPDFPHQEELGAKVMIAEIVAGECSRIVMEKKFSASSDLDAPAFYSEHLTYMQRYSARCHKILVHDAVQ